MVELRVPLDLPPEQIEPYMRAFREEHGIREGQRPRFKGVAKTPGGFDVWVFWYAD